jgi:hypothetical protein
MRLLNPKRLHIRMETIHNCRILGFHSHSYESCPVLGHNVMKSVYDPAGVILGCLSVLKVVMLCSETSAHIRLLDVISHKRATQQPVRRADNLAALCESTV